MSFQIQITGPCCSGKTSYINQFKDMTNEKGKVEISLKIDTSFLQLVPEDMIEAFRSAFGEKEKLAQMLGSDKVTFDLIKDNVTDKTRGHIILLDMTDPYGVQEMEDILIAHKDLYKNDPMIVIGYRADSIERIIFADKIIKTMQKYPEVIYYEVGDKSGYHIDKPLLMMASMLVDKDHIYYQSFKNLFETDFESRIRIRPIAN